MNLSDTAGLAVAAGLIAAWATAYLASRAIAANRREEDHRNATEDEFPGNRRSLHYIRQDVSALVTSLFVTNGLLAATLAAMLLRH